MSGVPCCSGRPVEQAEQLTHFGANDYVAGCPIRVNLGQVVAAQRQAGADVDISIDSAVCFELAFIPVLTDKLGADGERLPRTDKIGVLHGTSLGQRDHAVSEILAGADQPGAALGHCFEH